jgi:hypothetical protein
MPTPDVEAIVFLEEPGRDRDEILPFDVDL